MNKDKYLAEHRAVFFFAGTILVCFALLCACNFFAVETGSANSEAAVDADYLNLTTSPEGGTYDVSEGITLTVPRGAVASRTQLAVRPGDLTLVNPLLSSLGITQEDILTHVTCLPDGQNFEKPVCLRFQISGDRGSLYRIHHLDIAKGSHRLADCELVINTQEGYIELWVRHFSDYLIQKRKQDLPEQHEDPCWQQGLIRIVQSSSDTICAGECQIVEQLISITPPEACGLPVTVEQWKTISEECQVYISVEPEQHTLSYGETIEINAEALMGCHPLQEGETSFTAELGILSAENAPITAGRSSVYFTAGDEPGIAMISATVTHSFYPVVQVLYDGTTVTEGAERIETVSAVCAVQISPPDTQPPVPGNSGTITVDYTTQNVISIGWMRATDDVTERDELEYVVISSSEANIGSLAEALAHGTVEYDWVTNNNGVFIYGSPNSDYYINVLVRDMAGNMSAYRMAHARTKSAIAEIRIVPEYPVVPLDGTLQLTAIALDSGGNEIGEHPPFRWASNDPDRASVDTHGLVTGNNPTARADPVRITVTCGLDARESVYAEVEFTGIYDFSWSVSIEPTFELSEEPGESRYHEIIEGYWSGSAVVAADGTVLGMTSSGRYEDFTRNAYIDVCSFDRWVTLEKTVAITQTITGDGIQEIREAISLSGGSVYLDASGKRCIRDPLYWQGGSAPTGYPFESLKRVEVAYFGITCSGTPYSGFYGPTHSYEDYVNFKYLGSPGILPAADSSGRFFRTTWTDSVYIDGWRDPPYSRITWTATATLRD